MSAFMQKHTDNHSNSPRYHMCMILCREVSLATLHAVVSVITKF